MENETIQINFGAMECIISSLIFLATLFSAWYSLKYQVKGLDKNIEEMKNDVKTMTNGIAKHDKQIGIMKFKMDEIWKERMAVSASPMTLNERGKKVLEESEIREVVNKRLDEFYHKIKEKGPENAYQIQVESEKLMYKLKDETKMKDILEESAFRVGTDIDSILFVGSLYLRDILLVKFGYNFDDIDKHDPKKGKLETGDI